MARKTSNFLTNPKQLADVTKLFDPNTPANQMKVVSLKLIDAMISESTTAQEKNDFKLMRDNIELMSLDQIKDDVNDAVESTQEFLKFEKIPEKKEEKNIINNTSKLPISQLSTPNVNENLLAKAPISTGINATGLTPTELGLLSPEEQAIRLRQRGMA